MKRTSRIKYRQFYYFRYFVPFFKFYCHETNFKNIHSRNSGPGVKITLQTFIVQFEHIVVKLRMFPTLLFYGWIPWEPSQLSRRSNGFYKTRMSQQLNSKRHKVGLRVLNFDWRRIVGA